MSSIRVHYDVISNLPDTVLCYILSFLSTKQTVATSVLSKRWTHLWHSILDIDLTTDKDIHQTDSWIELKNEYALFRFNEFVHSVILKLESIKSFHLNVAYAPALKNRGFPSVVKWVDHVVQRGVENLSLSLFTSIEMKLPPSVLSCRTLVTLNLDFFDVKGFPSVRLPSLKVLHFTECTLRNNQDLLLLLAGCPMLEDLLLRMLVFLAKDSLTYQECQSLNLSKLAKARMLIWLPCHFPLKALHNVEELHIEINEVHRSFDEIPTFHNLTKLKLFSINWDLVVQVLNGCPKLQNLELCEGTLNGVKEYVLKNWVDPKYVPKCLSLHLKICKFDNFIGEQFDLMPTK